MADEQWQPVEKAAKNEKGDYVVFKEDKWIPAERVAKNEEGKFVAIYKDSSSESKKESIEDYAKQRMKVDPSSVFGQVQQGSKIGFEELGLAGQQYVSGGATPEQIKRLKELEEQKRGLNFVGKTATFIPQTAATIPALMATPAVGTAAGLAGLLGITGLSTAAMRPVTKETKGGKEFLQEKAQQVTEGVKEAEEGLLLGLGIFKGIPAAGKYLAGKYVGGKTQPAITDLAKQAEKEGFILDTAQLRPDKPISSPGFGKEAKINNENIATKKVTKETGLETENITPEFLKDRTEKFSKNYDRIFNRNFTIDADFAANLQQIASFERRVNPAGSGQIIGTAENLVSRWQNELLNQQMQQITKQAQRLTKKQGPMVGGVPQNIRSDFPTIYQKGDAGAPAWMDNVTDMINDLSVKFGLPKPPNVYAGVPRRDTLFGVATRNGDLVVISAKLDDAGAVSTALHEFGHNVEFQSFIYASDDVKKAVLNAYNTQLATLPKGGLTVSQHRPITAEKYGAQSRDTKATGSFEGYLRNFNEWFAEQTSRWITQTTAPTTVVDKFFKGIADKWKAIYARVKGYVPLVQEVDQFFRTNWTGDLLKDLVPTQTVKSASFVAPENITAAIPGKELQRLRSNLRDVANNNTDGAIRKAAGEFVTQIDAMIGKEKPELLEALIDTNRKYAATMALSDGIEKGFVTQGKINLEALGNYLAGKSYGYGLGTSRHPLYEAGYLGQQLKLTSRAEGAAAPPSTGIGGKYRTLSTLFSNLSGARTQAIGRNVQRKISEEEK
jgi:hypothetical protein